MRCVSLGASHVRASTERRVARGVLCTALLQHIHVYACSRRPHAGLHPPPSSPSCPQVLSEEARAVVRTLATRYPTAIVSGRARTTAQGLVQLDELYYAGLACACARRDRGMRILGDKLPMYRPSCPHSVRRAGSHGFDITGPLRPARRRASTGEAGEAGGDEEGATEPMASISYQVADSFRPALEEAKAHVEAAIAGIKGAMVEDNTFSVSVHYRMVAEGEDRERVQEIVDQVVLSMPMLRRTEGKMVYELRPSADWDKGKAVEWLLEQIQKEQESTVLHRMRMDMHVAVGAGMTVRCL